MEDTRIVGKSKKPANDNAGEPMWPHERVDYWLAKVAAVHGMTRTAWHCQMREGRYDAYIIVESKRLRQHRMSRVATVQAAPGQCMESAMRLLAWTLEEMVHVG